MQHSKDLVFTFIMRLIFSRCTVLINNYSLLYIFYRKMTDFKYEFAKLLLVSDGCVVLNLIPYCIILRYSAPLDNYLGFIFRYTHTNLCTSEY